MRQEALKSVEAHFQFGENWLDYLRHVDDEALGEAEAGLLRLLPLEAIQGARFLDIGCGSGLHSLAALRLGADALVAVDIDPNSVRATSDLISKWAPGARSEVRRLSIFEAEPEELGLFDIAYSWGVLHHTGAMWEAVERAARFVRPGGHFVIALYQKRPTCGLWTWEKRLYTRSPRLVRAAIRGGYTAAYFVRLLAGGRNPFQYVRAYKSSRGMNFYNDIHDWLGGYPYESATPEEVRARVVALGFEPAAERTLGKGLGLFGTGCAEYVFRRMPDLQP